MRRHGKESTDKKQKAPKSQKSQDQILRNIEDLQKCIINSSISSIGSVHEEYYPDRKAKSPDTEEMVLVSKYKLLRLFQEIKMLKRALKSQQKRIGHELESLKKGVREINHEKALLMRQQEYLKDMERSASEGKIKFYKSESNFYSARKLD